MKNKPVYIDLFSGCGGLSLGLKRVGFDLALAVEKSPMAAETYYHNFIKRIENKSEWQDFSSDENSIMSQAENKLVIKEIKEVLINNELMLRLKSQEIDLIAGGPPCQGFSLAGRRNPHDIRNQLPWQFLEFVERLEPKTVIIENVAGMRQNFVKHQELAPFEQLRIALADIGKGYFVQPVFLNAKHFGVPQNRPRVFLIAVRKDIGESLNITATNETWKSEYSRKPRPLFNSRPTLAPQALFFDDDILTVEDAIWDLSNKGYKFANDDISYSERKSNYAQFLRNDISWMPDNIRTNYWGKNIKNHNQRMHSDKIKMRFRLYQYLRDNNIAAKILNIPLKEGFSQEEKKANIAELLKHAKFPAISPDKYLLASNIDEFSKLIFDLATKKHSQRALKWNLPAPTIVSLPDDFVHPEFPRTLTVREMARFQSFPDSFEFRGKETTGGLKRRIEVPQYTQVGNAVPPVLAQAVGQVLYDILKKYQEYSFEKVV